MSNEFWSSSTSHAAAALADGRFADARAIYEILMKYSETQYGETDLRTAACHQGIGGAFLGMGEIGNAERHYRRAIAITERRLGAIHPISLKLLSALGVFYRRTSQNNRAEMTLRQALHGWEQLPTAPALDICETLDELSSLLSDVGRGKEAQPYSLRAAIVRQRTLAKDPADAIRSLMDLSEQQEIKGNAISSEILLKEALSVAESHCGRNHTKVAEILVRIGRVLLEDLRIEEALPDLERALCIYGNNLGDQDPRLADCLRALGRAYGRLGRMQRAAACFEDALENTRRVFGDFSVESARDEHRLALVYEEMGEFRRAEDCASNVYRIRKELLGEHNLEVAAILKDLADICAEADRTEAAREYELRAREAIRTAQPTSPLTAESPHLRTRSPAVA